MQNLVGHSENFGLYSEQDGSHRRVLSTGGTKLAYIVKIALTALWRTDYRGAKVEARSPVGL